MSDVARALLMVPPFPGARAREIVKPRLNQQAPVGQPVTAQALLAALRRHKICGAFWTSDDIWSPAKHDEKMAAAGDDPQLLLGAIAARPLLATSDGKFSHLADYAPGSLALDNALATLISQHVIDEASFSDPFDGQPVCPLTLVDILGGWRALIEANRPIAAAFGFAHWKRETVDPLLWGGTDVQFRAARSAELAMLPHDAAVAVWKARVPSSFLAELEAGPWRILEVEDGFIRSVGLGADCIPPLSIVVDDLGVHYDCSRPSRLEQMISHVDTPPDDLSRARELRDWIAQSGISKYSVSQGRTLPRLGGQRSHILVVGQVEDDRSVLFGSREVKSNLELLRRVRSLNPDAWIIYRPHPDVEAGHRSGAIPEETARALANQIEPAEPIPALIALVDEVHVMTSLAGFEALLRGTSVVTHGMPFYAGWGLSRDLAPPLPRRNVNRSIDELTAAVLLRYPRYVDPVTNLPCTAEIVIKRMISGVQRQNAALVPLRRALGWAKRTVSRLVGSR